MTEIPDPFAFDRGMFQNMIEFRKAQAMANDTRRNDVTGAAATIRHNDTLAQETTDKINGRT